MPAFLESALRRLLSIVPGIENVRVELKDFGDSDRVGNFDGKNWTIQISRRVVNSPTEHEPYWIMILLHEAAHVFQKATGQFTRRQWRLYRHRRATYVKIERHADKLAEDWYDRHFADDYPDGDEQAGRWRAGHDGHLVTVETMAQAFRSRRRHCL